MAGITLAAAQAQLDAYLVAETAVLGGQEYVIGGRRLKRADLAMIQAGVTRWDRRVKALSARSAGRGRSLTLRPRF